MSNRKEKGRDPERETEVVKTILVHVVCPGCGVPFAIPQEMAEERAESGSFISCPNGHTMSLNFEATQKRIAEARADQTVKKLVVPRQGVDPRSLRVDGPHQTGP